MAGTRGVVSTSRVATELGVSPASASEMLAKLAQLRLVRHDAYRGASLTPRGAAVALEILRHHRLIETYLVQALGYSWDEVHQEADRLEHAISEQLEERMWEALGRPEFDPHGDPIPARDGSVATRPALALDTAAAGAVVTISRVSDRDAQKLRAIQGLGLTPGVELVVVAGSEWEGPVAIAVGRRRVQVPLGLARAIYVEASDG